MRGHGRDVQTGPPLAEPAHRAEMAVDIAASVASNALLRKGRIRAELSLRYLLPVIGTAAVVPGDLGALRGTRRGRYVLEHMPAEAQAVRLVGDAILAVGAIRRRPDVMIAGFATLSRDGRTALSINPWG